MHVIKPGRRAHVRLPGTRATVILSEGEQVPDEVPAEHLARLNRAGLVDEVKPEPKTPPKGPKGNTSKEG